LSRPDTPLARRQFLAQCAAVTATLFAPSAHACSSPLVQQPSSHAGSPATRPLQLPNRDTTLKFNPDGSVRPFAGNTVICHLPVQCAMRTAMVQLHDQLVAAPYRPKLGLTTTASYHMTIFNGANDQDRDRTGWPSYVPINAPIDVCNREVGKRMAAAHLQCALPVRVRVDQAATLAHPTACTLRMVPVDAAESAKLLSVREKLASIFGIQRASDAHYGLHITMSYQIAPFTEQESQAYHQLLHEHLPRILAAAPVLELGNPEFCTFPDMLYFEPVKLIACC
jgi:hypothetical protein